MSEPYRLGKLTRTRTDGTRHWSYCIIWPDPSAKSGRARVSLGTTDKAAAPALAREFWGKRTLALVDTVGAVMDAYLATLAVPFPGWTKPDACDHKQRTAIKDGQRKREGWKQSQGFWAGLRMSDIDEETSEEYKVWRDRSVNTMRNELGHIRTSLSWGERKGIITTAPKIVVPAIPDSKVDHLTKVQFRKFITGCKMPHVKLFAMLAVATGARKTALLQLKWEQISFERRMAFLNPDDREQNGKDRATVPLNDQIMEALREAKELATSDYVIEYQGQPVADIKKGIVLASGRSGIRAHPHMFRHSAAVWMAEDRNPMEEIATFLGHRNIKMTIRVYARFHPDYLRKAARSLEW